MYRCELHNGFYSISSVVFEWPMTASGGFFFLSEAPTVHCQMHTAMLKDEELRSFC